MYRSLTNVAKGLKNVKAIIWIGTEGGTGEMDDAWAIVVIKLESCWTQIDKEIDNRYQ